MDDAAAWAFLALVVGIVGANEPLNALYIVLMTIAYAALMLFGVRRVLAKLFDRGVSSDGSISEWVIVCVMVLVRAYYCCVFISFSL